MVKQSSGQDVAAEVGKADAKKDKSISGEVINVPKRTRSKKGSVAKLEPTGILAGVTTEQLEVALDTQTAQRKLIKEFIQKHLVKGIDYLRIHVVRNCATEDKQRGSCKFAGHFSKDILAKPGQEKIFSLFNLTGKLTKDTETLDMLGNPKGTVALKCDVYRGELWVTEGRGAATVGDNRRDANSTIKIAEKRARMDAALSLGFSEYFAQDLDDPDYQNQKKMAEEQAAGQADDGSGLPSRPANSPINDLERRELAKLLLKAGFNSREEQIELLALNDVPDPSKMTSGQARDLIKKMKTNAFTPPTTTGTVLDDLEGIDEEAVAEVAEQKAAKAVEAEKLADLAKVPELVVDDDLKAAVEERAVTIGLNNRGHMWLMQKITGRPFGKWDKLTDEQWRKAYDLIMAIMDGKIEVEDFYINKDTKPPTQTTLTGDIPGEVGNGKSK